MDLSKIFTERKIDLRSINSRTSKQEKATISMSFEIGSKEELRSLIEKIRQVESVIDVERTTKTKKRGSKMSEFNEQDNIIEEETPVLHLELEDGTEQDCISLSLPVFARSPST